MAQAVRAVQKADAPEEEERQAVQTLSVMQQTSLYDTMIEQINGGRLRVAEMLGKYDFVFASPDTETTPEDLQAFDMNDYM
jgi:predicted O-methyltransferase YrrM